MECKQSSVKQYDPAKPRRAKNLRDPDWEPMKATVTKGHELGHTRTQILQLLETRHNFFASPAQLNKQMARWGLRVKGKDRAAVEGESESFHNESTTALPASNEEAADGEETCTLLHSQEVQAFVDARANPADAHADRPGRPYDAAGKYEVDDIATESPELISNPPIRLEDEDSPHPVAQQSPASAPKQNIEMSSENVDAEPRLSPFSTVMQMIREYRPSDAARELWEACGPNPQCKCGNAELSKRCNLWKMVVQNGILLHHQYSADTPEERSSFDETIAKAIARNRRILQMLIKAAVGCATTCPGVRHVQHTNLLLDAALHVAGQSGDPRTVSSLATFFDFHRENLAELWPQKHGVYSESNGTTGAAALRESSKVSDPYLFFHSVIGVIHPTIIDREYLFIWTHLIRSPRRNYLFSVASYQCLRWERPLVEFLRRMDPRPARSDGGEWDPESAVYVSFIERYLTEVKLFLYWCSKAVQEWTTSDGGRPVEYCPFAHGSPPMIDSQQASLSLYWFLVGRLRLTSRNPRQLDSNLPASLNRTGHGSTIFDAVFVLSQLVLDRDGWPFPGDSGYQRFDEDRWYAHAQEGMSKLLLSPHKFVWHYLCQVAGLAARRERTLDKVTGEQEYLQAVILSAPPKKDESRLILGERKGQYKASMDWTFGVNESIPSDSGSESGSSRESSPADAASAYCRTLFSVRTFATSSSMSQDTRTFRHEARRYRENELVRRKHQPQAPSYQSSWDLEMEFERTSGMPARPPLPDVMEDAPQDSSRG